MNVPFNVERRRFPRHSLDSSCKLLDRRTARFWPAQTADVSEGGALLRVALNRPLRPGDQIDVYISRDRRAVLDSSDATRARVVRVISSGPVSQAVAVEFECRREPASLPQLVAA